jgi:hypothetical protein
MMNQDCLIRTIKLNVERAQISVQACILNWHHAGIETWDETWWTKPGDR